MKRTILLLPLLLLLRSAAVEADDFGEFRVAIRNAYADGSARDRLAAVESVASYRDERSVKLLVQMLPRQMQILEDLIAQRDAIQAGRSRNVGGRSPGPFLQVVKEKLDDEYRVLEAYESAGFSHLTDQKAIRWLAKTAMLRDRLWKTREMIARVLAKIGDRSVIEPLAKALRDKDPRVKTAALLSLGKLRAEEEVDAIIDRLDSGEEWIVRSAAIEALGQIRDAKAIEPLLEALETETGVLRDDVARSLEKITGQELGDAIEAWKGWWAANRERVLAGERPEAAPKVEKPDSAEEGRYYEMPVKSKRTIFIIDISESMSYSTEEYQEKPKPGEMSRLDLAKSELTRVLKHYGQDGTFAVIAFHTVVKAWRPRIVVATKVMKQDATEWINSQEPTGTTNIYAALELAFQMAGMGVIDRYYPPAADTIYLLSDGAPTNQDLSDDDPERILRAVREWNRLGRMKIHTIGLKGHSVDFMSRLAKENGGTYVSRE